MAKKKVTTSDRYSALGIPSPSAYTVCLGQCEGTGLVPVKKTETDPILKRLWKQAEAVMESDDGWHFVKCPVCGGSGLRKSASKKQTIKNK